MKWEPLFKEKPFPRAKKKLSCGTETKGILSQQDSVVEPRLWGAIGLHRFNATWLAQVSVCVARGENTFKSSHKWSVRHSYATFHISHRRATENLPEQSFLIKLGFRNKVGFAVAFCSLLNLSIKNAVSRCHAGMCWWTFWRVTGDGWRGNRRMGVWRGGARRKRFYYARSSLTVAPLCPAALVSSSLLHQKQAVVRAATCGLGPG